jgi:hypothetical protein
MPSSTLGTKFARLLISTLPMLLLTMLSTVTNGQVIDKDPSAKPQPKDAYVKPEAKDISAKSQTKPNARSLSGGDTQSQKKIRTGDSGAVALEATSGSFRFDTSTQGKRSYHVKTPYGALNVSN